MISANTLSSELINKIAQDLTQATSLAAVAINIRGNEISELLNFTPFYQLMRWHPEHNEYCRMSDHCGGLEASKNDQLYIYRCHARLAGFSIPLVIAGYLVSFVLCGQVYLSNDIESVDTLNVNDRRQSDPALAQAFRDAPEVDYPRVIASVDLLKLIVENCLKKQLNFVVIKDNPPQNDPAQASRATSLYDGKVKEAFHYIDVHLSDELRLEDMVMHVYLSPYHFSKLFKEYQGIDFNTQVSQQRMASVKELLCHNGWSAASITRNLGFSQTSYFCKVSRQTYQVTPQAFRQQINAGSQTESP